MSGRRLRLVAYLIMFHWLLSACGTMTIKDAATQSYVPIQGWSLELHRDVEIPADQTRVFFQEGRLLYGINEYKPHCQLLTRTISGHPRVVRADRFDIDKVSGRLEEVVSNRRIQLAAAADHVIAEGGNGEGRLFFLYYLGLHSDSQPDVTYLACGGAGDEPALADYPTIQDIRASLGDYATLILPAGG